MKVFLSVAGLPVAFLAATLSANAAMYKCTDANGNVAFSDKACPEEKQEVLKEHTASGAPAANPPDAMKVPEDEAFPTLKRIEPLPGGRKVTSSSPLAKVYMVFSVPRNAATGKICCGTFPTRWGGR